VLEGAIVECPGYPDPLHHGSSWQTPPAGERWRLRCRLALHPRFVRRSSLAASVSIWADPEAVASLEEAARLKPHYANVALSGGAFMPGVRRPKCPWPAPSPSVRLARRLALGLVGGSAGASGLEELGALSASHPKIPWRPGTRHRRARQRFHRGGVLDRRRRRSPDY
jgi:hypothetical protein